VLGGTFYLALILGLVLLLSQAADIIYLVAPKKWLQMTHLVGPIVTPSALKQERCSKTAAGFKVSRMLDNALEVAGRIDGARTISKSSKHRASLSDPDLGTMERYLLFPEQREGVGGVFWAWKVIPPHVNETLESIVSSSQFVFFFSDLN